MSVLEDHGAVDLDERQRAWRDEGWSGQTQMGDSTRTVTPTAAATPVLSTGNAHPVAQTPGDPMADEVDRVASSTALGGPRVRTYAPPI